MQIRDQGRHTAGTGLGLAVCKRLVKALGGQISLDSSPGIGTTVSFELEFELAPAPVSEPLTTLANCSHPSLTPGHRILLVEDDEVNALVLERFLAMLGQVPLCADCVHQALRIAREGEFALAIVDMNLPDGDGMGLLSKLRGMPAHRNTPVILISAHVRHDEVEQLLASGFDAVLQKPVTQAQLESVLAGLASNPKATASGQTKEEPAPCSEERIDKAFLCAERDALGMATVEQIAALFIRQGDSLIDSLAEAASHGQTADVRHFAHKLRGSAANLGLRQLSRHAAAVEEAWSDKTDKLETKREVDALVADYRQTCVELREVLLALASAAE